MLAMTDQHSQATLSSMDRDVGVFLQKHDRIQISQRMKHLKLVFVAQQPTLTGMVLLADQSTIASSTLGSCNPNC